MNSWQERKLFPSLGMGMAGVEGPTAGRCGRWIESGRVGWGPNVAKKYNFFLLMFFREIWNAMGAGIVWIGGVGLVLEKETGWEKMSGEVVCTCTARTRPLPRPALRPPPPPTCIWFCALWRRQHQRSVPAREGKVFIYSFMGTWSGEVCVLPL